MPVRPDAPLRKVTLNLYEEDVVALEVGHGQGWSTCVREIVHEGTHYLRKHMPKPRTLGDLADE